MAPVFLAAPGQLAALTPAAIRPPMSVSNEQVRHIAKLARIGMSDAEIEALVPELNNILGWVEQLGEVDTDGVEPLTAVIDQKLRLRDDVVTTATSATRCSPTRPRRSTVSSRCRR